MRVNLRAGATYWLETANFKDNYNYLAHYQTKISFLRGSGLHVLAYSHA